MTIPFRGICFASAALALFSHCAAADQEPAAPKATASEPTASEVAIPAATAPEAVVQESDDSGLSFNAGADLRIRQEIMDHVPGNPYGGFRAFRFRESGYRNHIRFRPRVWAEVKGDAGSAGLWTLYGRLADEFRWNSRPANRTTAWPGEIVLDNLYLEGKDVFDGFLDLKVGRQNLRGLCGLDRIFVDGTPGDGSRTLYTDMASVRFHVNETSTLDVFGLYNFDSASDFRIGDDRHRLSSLASRFPDGSGNQDDWGAGVVWGQKPVEWLEYQVFAVTKRLRETQSPQRSRRTDLIGARVQPRLSETVKADFDLMYQRCGEWSGFAGIDWKSSRDGWKPLCGAYYRYMSGKWDPMWGRDAIESEMYLYGTHNGVGWWSNQHYLKLWGGVEFAPRHKVVVSTGPVFAADRDGVGGGNGRFKGLFSRALYTFPIWTPARDKGERFEIYGHVIAELFNPGDYYDTDKPGYFFRWQIDFAF